MYYSYLAGSLLSKTLVFLATYGPAANHSIPSMPPHFQPLLPYIWAQFRLPIPREILCLIFFIRNRLSNLSPSTPLTKTFREVF